MSPLLVRGRSDRDYPEQPRVDARSHAADRPALAPGVPTLEHEHGVYLAFLGFPSELAKARLLLGELPLVRPAGELGLQIDLVEYGAVALAGQRHRTTRPGAGLPSDRELFQAALHGCQQGAPYREVAVARIGGLDNVPGSVAGIGDANGAFRDLGQALVVLGVLLELRRCHPDPQLLFESGLLVLLAQVEPELDDQATVVDEQLLEIDDTTELALESMCVGVP